MSPTVQRPRRCHGRRRQPGSRQGFTLLEVMIALTLFFMAAFAILDTTNQSLRAARSLQLNAPDVGMLAREFLLTNRIDALPNEGDFGDFYPGFVWYQQNEEVATNGLYRVDFTIEGTLAGRPYQARTSMLLWSPDTARFKPGLR